MTDSCADPRHRLPATEKQALQQVVWRIRDTGVGRCAFPDVVARSLPLRKRLLGSSLRTDVGTVSLMMPREAQGYVRCGSTGPNRWSISPGDAPGPKIGTPG